MPKEQLTQAGWLAQSGQNIWLLGAGRLAPKIILCNLVIQMSIERVEISDKATGLAAGRAGNGKKRRPSTKATGMSSPAIVF